jgi:LCP family protein required for cell wall assembly
MTRAGHLPRLGNGRRAQTIQPTRRNPSVWFANPFLPLIFLSTGLNLLVGCNFPAPTSTPPAQKPAQSTARPVLISWSGTPTSTPFQPLEPTEPPASPPASTLMPDPVPSASPPTPPPSSVFSDADMINFLLIGSDRRTTSFRTDTLIVVSVRPRQRLVTLISIPRDLYIYIPGWEMQRINTAYMHGETNNDPGGGPGLLKETIRYNLGIQIDHMAMVEFDGFQQIVDILGGIDVPLACPFTDWHIKNPRRSDQDPNNWRLYTIGPGVVHMDGDLALWYARSRLRSSDFDRGRRQQEVLRAIYTRGLQLDVIPHLPRLYKQLHAAITTDLSLDDMLGLAPLAVNLGGEQRIRSFYINKEVVTPWITPGGAAVQLPKKGPLRDLIQEAMSPPNKDEKEQLKTLVEVRNGSANPDWDILAAERLHYAGFRTRITEFDQDDHHRSFVYDFTPDQDPEISAALLDALGLPPSSLIANPDLESSVQYRLVLGDDYDPCFNPANFLH